MTHSYTETIIILLCINKADFYAHRQSIIIWLQKQISFLLESNICSLCGLCAITWSVHATDQNLIMVLSLTFHIL